MERVLQVDPDEGFREEFGRLLRRENVALTGAATLAEAECQLKSRDFFCALVDVAIRDAPWPYVLLALKSIRHGLPIILTADRSCKDVEVRARLEGVTYYYVKSFARDELLEALREILNLSRKAAAMKSATKKILVIDDDPDYQEAIKVILESGGYEVVQAYNKDEGKAKLESESPDLIVLDIMMESTSAGFHFLYETLGADQARKLRVPVLAVSSISKKTGFKFSPTTDEDFFPADDYLEKPVKCEELLDHIALLLEGRTPRRV